MIYLVRHGECEFPKETESYCIGLTDLPLSERGRRQAEDLAAYFADKNIKVVYHSNLLRAKQTAVIVSNGKYPIKQAEGLEEINMGEWDGLSFREIREKYPRLYEKRGRRIVHVAPPGAENFLQGLARFSAAFKRIQGEEDGNMVIVSHAGVNRIFLCEALGLNFNKVLTVAQPNGCINTLVANNGCFSVAGYGRMPLDAPEETECAWLLKRYGTPDNIAAHCIAVSRKAVKIAESLNSNVRLNLELIKSAGLLHDLARMEKNHDKIAYHYLIKYGYPLVAGIVRSHHNLERKDLENISESTIVFYADKLINGTEEVSLEERFSISRERCLTPEALASHRRQYDQAVEAKALILNAGKTEAFPAMEPKAGTQ